MSTADDVGPRMVGGIPVPLSLSERQQIANERNQREQKKINKQKQRLIDKARANAYERALQTLIASDTILSNEIASINSMNTLDEVLNYDPS